MRLSLKNVSHEKNRLPKSITIDPISVPASRKNNDMVEPRSICNRREPNLRIVFFICLMESDPMSFHEAMPSIYSPFWWTKQ